MAIRTVITRGYGNGTFNGSIALVVTRGYAIGAVSVGPYVFQINSDGIIIENISALHFPYTFPYTFSVGREVEPFSESPDTISLRRLSV